MKLAKWLSSPPPDVFTFSSWPGADGKPAFSSSAFGEMAAAFATRGGSPLRGLLIAAGKSPDTTDPIVLCGFSAGYGLLEPILATPKDAARIAAVGSFDAYYTNASKAPKPGYLAYAKQAAAGGRPMILTSSKIAGPTYPSGEDAAAALLASLELPTIPLESVGKAVCTAAYGRGKLRWYSFADRTDLPSAAMNLKASHAQHATILAPFFAPELADGLSSTRSSSSSSGFGALLAFLGVLFLLDAVRA